MSDYIDYKVRVFKNGSKYWYLNSNYHREDGPAMEYANGAKHWYLNGELHREDGPALEYTDGEKRWYLNDIDYTEPEYKVEMERRRNTCNGKTVIIEGKEYILTEVNK